MQGLPVINIAGNLEIKAQLMNTSVFQNVGEGNKSLNAMSPGPLLSVAFGKGSR